MGRDPREPEPFFLREPLLPEEWAVVQEVREEEGAAAEFEPLRLRNGYDWFYRPVVRKYCTMRDYIDGAFDLVDIADMNDLIDAVDENDRRQNDAREKQRREAEASRRR